MKQILVAILLQRIVFSRGYALVNTGTFGTTRSAHSNPHFASYRLATSNDASISGNKDTDVQEATVLLTEWDMLYSKDERDNETESRLSQLRPLLAEAVTSLNQAATIERQQQADLGRCMLGICASSTKEGLQTLKAWVSKLELPRGLLHGMDVDGVPIEINGGVYIKYNSGGVYTFADVRKSQLGFDALWKPGMTQNC